MRARSIEPSPISCADTLTVAACATLDF